MIQDYGLEVRRVQLAVPSISNNPGYSQSKTFTYIMEEEKPKKDISGEKPKVKIKIGDNELEAVYREFKSGKKGYGCYGVIKINDWPCRLSLNLIEM